MTTSRARFAVALPLLALAGCISQNPPAPPVRWFDPVPAAGAPTVGPRVEATAAPFLRQDFVLRMGSRELAIDEFHRWIAPPEQLVAAAIEQVTAGRAPATRLRVHVIRFEFAVAPPAARVAVLLLRDVGGVEVQAEAPATGTEPGALADAMAAALADLARKVADAASDGG